MLDIATILSDPKMGSVLYKIEAVIFEISVMT